MVARVRARRTFRVIAHRPFDRPISNRLPSVTSQSALNQLEALTNPRIRQEWSPRRKIRLEDLGASPEELAVASFVYSGASRFTDGSFGVYYAGFERETAIAESSYHTTRFLRDAHLPATSVFKRLLEAELSGSYEDVRSRGGNDPIYDPQRYDASQRFGLEIYARDRRDGVVYRSVRCEGGTCVVAFRPRLIRNCVVAETLLYAWNGERIDGVMRVEPLP